MIDTLCLIYANKQNGLVIKQLHFRFNVSIKSMFHSDTSLCFTMKHLFLYFKLTINKINEKGKGKYTGS